MNILNRLKLETNFATLQSKVAAENLANIYTPNYKEKHVTMKKSINDLNIFNTNAQHLSKSSDYKITYATRPNIEGNTASLEKNLMDFQETQNKAFENFAFFKAFLEIIGLPQKIMKG